MKSSYPSVRLGDFCEKIGSGATPKGGKEVYLDTGEFTLIRSQNVLNSQFSFDGLAFITPEAAEKLKSVSVNSGDVLLNITGDSVARCCSAPAGVLPARVNQHVAIIRPDPSELSPRYVQYFLVSQDQQDHMLKLANAGATRNALTKGMIEAFLLPKPDRDTQSAITKILGDLDDKIDLLRRMNLTLEDVARTLFKAWFVDYLPVRAKSQGFAGFRGMPQDLFDQLPESFESSRIGEIPKGWEVGAVGNMLTLSRQSIKPFEQPDDIFQHFSLPAYDRNQEPDLAKGSTIKSAKFTVPDGAVLFSKLNPRIPRIWLPRPARDETVQIASTEFLVCSPRDGWTRSYLYALVSQDWFIDNLTKKATGTSSSHQRIKPAQFENVPLAIPPKELREGFEAAVGPLVGQTIANREEQATLADLRNTLLPKLISGELEAPNLKALGIGEAA